MCSKPADMNSNAKIHPLNLVARVVMYKKSCVNSFNFNKRKISLDNSYKEEIQCFRSLCYICKKWVSIVPPCLVSITQTRQLR